MAQRSQVSYSSSLQFRESGVILTDVEVLRHAQVHDHVHWLSRHESLSDVQRRSRREARLFDPPVDGPVLDPVGVPVRVGALARVVLDLERLEGVPVDRVVRRLVRP